MSRHCRHWFVINSPLITLFRTLVWLYPLLHFIWLVINAIPNTALASLSINLYLSLNLFTMYWSSYSLASNTHIISLIALSLKIFLFVSIIVVLRIYSICWLSISLAFFLTYFALISHYFIRYFLGYDSKVSPHLIGYCLDWYSILISIVISSIILIISHTTADPSYIPCVALQSLVFISFTIFALSQKIVINPLLNNLVLIYIFFIKFNKVIASATFGVFYYHLLLHISPISSSVLSALQIL